MRERVFSSLWSAPCGGGAATAGRAKGEPPRGSGSFPGSGIEVRLAAWDLPSPNGR